MKSATTLLTIIAGTAALVVPRAVTQVASLEELDTIIKGTSKVSANFCAVWSGACMAMEEHYRSLSDQYNEISFVNVDIDRVGTKKAAEKYNFNAIPTFVTFKGGKEFGNRVIGPAHGALDEQIARLANS
jgi:thioredoxin 1